MRPVNSKYEALNSKVKKNRNNYYDLEERTLIYAKRVIEFVNKVPKNLPNIELCKQLVKASGSVGANYIEANEALSKKDFKVRVKICKKEAKESRFWLKLICCPDKLIGERDSLIAEATELMKIFGAILEKTK